MSQQNEELLKEVEILRKENFQLQNFNVFTSLYFWCLHFAQNSPPETEQVLPDTEAAIDSEDNAIMQFFKIVYWFDSVREVVAEMGAPTHNAPVDDKLNKKIDYTSLMEERSVSAI